MLVLKSGKKGFTLLEMLVVVAILSILSAVAIPFTIHGATRAKEIQLKQSLRIVRAAIDQFHMDCEEGKISSNSDGVSRYCYPESLEVLVEGVDSGDTQGTIERYLRRIPRDPFLNHDSDIEDQWHLRGYQDDIGSSFWNGEDVFDISVTHDLESIDKGAYRDW